MAYRRRDDDKPLPKGDQVIACKAKLEVAQLLVNGQAAWIVPCACCRRPVELPFRPRRSKVCEECQPAWEPGECLTVRGAHGLSGGRIDTRCVSERRE